MKYLQLIQLTTGNISNTIYRTCIAYTEGETIEVMEEMYFVYISMIFSCQVTVMPINIIACLLYTCVGSHKNIL